MSNSPVSLRQTSSLSYLKPRQSVFPTTSHPSHHTTTTTPTTRRERNWESDGSCHITQQKGFSLFLEINAWLKVNLLLSAVLTKCKVFQAALALGLVQILWFSLIWFVICLRTHGFSTPDEDRHSTVFFFLLLFFFFYYILFSPTMHSSSLGCRFAPLPCKIRFGILFDLT